MMMTQPFPLHPIDNLYPVLKEHPDAWTHLQALWARGTKLLGSRLAILGGAMTWVSDPTLVGAMSNAGGFGVLASGAMSPDQLGEVIDETRRLTPGPFGVNLILLHPQITEMIAVCRARKVSHVFFAGGIPTKEQVRLVLEGGSFAIAFAPTGALAKRLVTMGVSGLIIEGTEAGGHIGPVSSSVLAQEILPLIQDVPVFVAGGIGTGAMMLSYMRMGASGAQLGTRIVCAEESKAHPRFKQAFIRAQAREAVVSPQLDPRFPVIPVRALKNKGMQLFIEKQSDVIKRFDTGEISLEEGQLEIEHFWAGALRRAVQDGDVEAGSLMAGQSVGQIKAVEPLRDILAGLLAQMLHDLGNKNNAIPNSTRAQG